MPYSKLFKTIGSVLLTLAICALAYWALSQAYQAGYIAGSDKVSAAWQKERKALQDKVAELSQQVASLQHDLDTKNTQFERRSHEEKQALIADHERRMAAVTHRVERVYIPAKIPPDYCDTAGAATPGASPRIREERCELDPATVADLASLTRDGDLAIIERNELIDRYNAARAALIKFKQLETTK